MKQLLQPLINGFYRILEVILVINMIIMFVLVFMNVVLRLGFNTGIDFAEEVPPFRLHLDDLCRGRHRHAQAHPPGR